MLEHFNDYISIGVLIIILLVVLYIVFKILLNTIERNRIRKEMQNAQNRKEE